MVKASGDGTHIVYRFLTPRNQLCLLAGFGLYAGWNYRNPQLLTLGLFALTAVISGVLFAYLFRPEVKVERRHTPRAFEQQTLPVELYLSNSTKYSPSLVLIEDYFPPAGYTRFRHLVLKPFSKKHLVRMKYRANCNNRRGLYTNGPISVEAFDPLGLFRRRVYLEEFTDIVLYPNTTALEYFSVLSDGTLRHVGLESIMRPGESAEFTGLRPYQQGDPPNKIHWRSSARGEEFHVKEFQESIVTDVTIFLDLGKFGLTGLGEHTSVEYAIKATASIARKAIESGHLVQVIMVGLDIEHIPLGTGQKHLLMILDRLALAKAEHESHFHKNVMKQIPLLRRGGTAIMIQSITTIQPDWMNKIVGSLEIRNIKPVVLGVDDRAFIKLYREQEETHISALSTEDTIRELVLKGIKVHIVTKHTHPMKAIQRGLEYEEHFDEG